LKPNGVFLVDKKSNAKIVVSEKYPKEKDVKFATQSGPMLLIDGKVHPKFTDGSKNKLPRNGVGIISPTKVVFAISDDDTNFFDFAMLFKEQFKCENALFLDGNVSRMYIPKLKRFEKSGEFGVIIGVTLK